MKRLALACLIFTLPMAACTVASGQETADTSRIPTELQDAHEQRRALLQTPEFRARIQAVQQARVAREEAIRAIPEVQQIDERINALRREMFELHKQRRELVEQKAAEYAAEEATLKQAEADLEANDPVRQAMKALREDAMAETETDSE